MEHYSKNPRFSRTISPRRNRAFAAYKRSLPRRSPSKFTRAGESSSRAGRAAIWKSPNRSTSSPGKTIRLTMIFFSENAASQYDSDKISSPRNTDLKWSENFDVNGKYWFFCTYLRRVINFFIANWLHLKIY